MWINFGLTLANYTKSSNYYRYHLTPMPHIGPQTRLYEFKRGPSTQHWQIYIVNCKEPKCFMLYNLYQQIFAKKTYFCTETCSHSTVHQTGRFYCLIPAVCSLHHRCRSLQSCRLYWRECVEHLLEYQDHHSLQLEKTKQYASRCYVYWLWHGTQAKTPPHYS